MFAGLGLLFIHATTSVGDSKAQISSVDIKGPSAAPNRQGANDEKQSLLLKVFPPSTFEATNSGRTTLTHRFSPSKGPWAKGLDERNVFHGSITHEQDAANSFELRVGVGGQIYSLVGPFGESVPPSWRAQGPTSPWNDEVWQFVAVCTRYNKVRDLPDWLEAAKPYSTSYFIHNSGCYMKGDKAAINNLYCPLLATEFKTEARSIRMLNWGLVPQMQTIHRSPLLFYTQVRDAGDGVIELTWVVHNFSVRDDVVFDHLNAPWGGTRVSNLPLNYVSTPSGNLILEDIDNEKFANGGNVRKTGGFAIASADTKQTSPSLALVYGLDQHLERETAKRKNGLPHTQFKPSLYRSWRANGPSYKRAWKDFKSREANSFRNFQVVEIIPKLRLKPQSSIWYRSYLVVGGKEQCRQLSQKLVDHVDYGRRDFASESTPMLTIGAKASTRRFKLFAQPVKGTLPVFAIRHKPTGDTVFTTDPYHFTPQKKLTLKVPASHPDHDYFKSTIGYTLDGQSEFLGLLGFGYQTKPSTAGWQQISALSGQQRSGTRSAYDVDVWAKTVD